MCAEPVVHISSLIRAQSVQDNFFRLSTITLLAANCVRPVTTSTGTLSVIALDEAGLLCLLIYHIISFKATKIC
ncbi:MAG: hypothetical protein JXJ04_21690 [Spirochaetales bacterium]|nr:hypothetical protein [Spirochaetales bacterium]